MAGLVSLFGDKPRVRVLQAIIELSPHEFTMTELAEESGLSKNVYREADGLEREGLIERIDSRRPALYRVRTDATRFRALDVVSLMLDRLEGIGHDTIEARQLIEMWQGQLAVAEGRAPVATS